MGSVIRLVSHQGGLSRSFIRLVSMGLPSGWSQQVSHQGGLNGSPIRVVSAGLSSGWSQ